MDIYNSNKNNNNNTNNSQAKIVFSDDYEEGGLDLDINDVIVNTRHSPNPIVGNPFGPLQRKKALPFELTAAHRSFIFIERESWRQGRGQVMETCVCLGQVCHGTQPKRFILT